MVSNTLSTATATFGHVERAFSPELVEGETSLALLFYKRHAEILRFAQNDVRQIWLDT
jgi:hypothetical protein